MANIYGEPDIFERAGGWFKDKWNQAKNLRTEPGQTNQQSMYTPGGYGVSNMEGTGQPLNVNWFGGNTLGPGGYGEAAQNMPNAQGGFGDEYGPSEEEEFVGPYRNPDEAVRKIDSPNQDFKNDDSLLEEGDYGDTPGADNLLGRSQEGTEGFGTQSSGKDSEMKIPNYEESAAGGPEASPFDVNEETRKTMELENKMTNSKRPFKNLFEKMQKGMDKFDKGNIGSAKWDENEFMLDKEGNQLKDKDGNPIVNENFGNIIDQGKGLFGKEGGFMSKFGTGKGAMSGLLGGLGKALSASQGQGGGGAPGEYMYKSPWEGVE